MKKILFCLLFFITLHLNAENPWLKSLKLTINENPSKVATVVIGYLASYSLLKVKNFAVGSPLIDNNKGFISYLFFLGGSQCLAELSWKFLTRT